MGMKCFSVTQNCSSLQSLPVVLTWLGFSFMLPLMRYVSAGELSVLSDQSHRENVVGLTADNESPVQSLFSLLLENSLEIHQTCASFEYKSTIKHLDLRCGNKCRREVCN